MSSSSSNLFTSNKPKTGGEKAASGIKGVIGAVHGAGEAIRGNVNSFGDELSGDHAAKNKNAAVAQKGITEIETGKFNSRDMEPTTQTTGKRIL